MAYTTIDKPADHFQTVLWTGNATDDRAINIGMQPDLVWWKHRTSSSYWHYLVDSSRGIGKQLYANASDAEGTHTGGHVKSYTSTGITLDDDQAINHGSTTYVGWMWKANGGTRTTNSESGDNPGGGYQANTTAGFSIVDYTGTGATGTMAHGLGAVPHCIIAKQRTAVGGVAEWVVYHKSLGNTHYVKLSTSAGQIDSSGLWNDTSPTSSVFTVNTSHQINEDTGTYIAYAFTEIQGYSKFGFYKGNGNADGTFIYTGFKPALVIQKQTNADGEYWMMKDHKRKPYNVTEANIYPNVNNVEGDTNAIDLLSNGFKNRSSGAGSNASSATYIYMAWAEQPFVSSEGVPCPAN